MSGDKDGGCLACAIKDLQIIWLRQRIALLEREVKRLKAIIQRAKVICASIVNNADRVMSDHQPRAKWAFALAAKTAAQTIHNMLG